MKYIYALISLIITYLIIFIFLILTNDYNSTIKTKCIEPVTEQVKQEQSKPEEAAKEETDTEKATKLINELF